MKYLLLGLALAGATGCAIQASVPGASVAVVGPAPVFVARPYYRRPRAYYVTRYEYEPRYARPRHRCDDGY